MHMLHIDLNRAEGREPISDPQLPNEKNTQMQKRWKKRIKKKKKGEMWGVQNHTLFPKIAPFQAVKALVEENGSVWAERREERGAKKKKFKKKMKRKAI